MTEKIAISPEHLLEAYSDQIINGQAGLRPGKILPPAARGRKAVFPLQFRPTCGIPEGGEAGFRFRDFEAVLHTVKRVVKTQGVCSRRKCPPQQAPVISQLFSDFVKKLKDFSYLERTIYVGYAPLYGTMARRPI